MYIAAAAAMQVNIQDHHPPPPLVSPLRFKTTTTKFFWMMKGLLDYGPQSSGENPCWADVRNIQVHDSKHFAGGISVVQPGLHIESPQILWRWLSYLSIIWCMVSSWKACLGKIKLYFRATN